MRTRWLIGFVLLALFLSACHSPTSDARHMVRRAEQLADSLPDSTARLIDSVLRMPVSFSERERMDMAFLQGEALFRNVPLDDDGFEDSVYRVATSPELERAADYYARKKRYDKAAHAALYSGYVQQHYNEKEAAMRSFKAAEQYSLLSNDSLTAARAEFRMGKMLLDDGMEQEALVLLQAAKLGFETQSVEKALVWNMMGVCYLLRDDVDNAEVCLNQALLIAGKKQNKANKAKYKVWNNFSVLYRIQKKYDQAFTSLHQMVNDSSFGNSERIVLYLNLGKVCVDMRKMDSAAKYFHRMEALLTSTDVKKETIASAYGALTRFAELQNEIALALQYREKHERVLYDVMMQRQNQTIYCIQRQYDYESLQNVMNRKIIQRHRVIITISIMLLIATSIVIITQYRNKQLLKSENEMKQQIDAMKQDLQQRVKSSVLDQEISLRLRLVLLANRTIQRATDSKKEWQPLAMKIMNDKSTPFEAAQGVLEMVYPHLYSTIRENYPDLTETEAKICLLSCSDLSNADIAELLGLRLNTVNQNRSNLRKKLNLKPDKMKEQLRKVLSE